MQKFAYGYRPLHWDRLGRLGRSRIMSLTILMPVIGYMILFNENVFSYLSLKKEIIGGGVSVSVEPGVPLEWTTSYRLYCLYFGLSFFGIASLIFKLCCPDLAQNYRHADSYIENAMPYLTREKSGKLPSRISELKNELPSFTHSSHDYTSLTNYAKFVSDREAAEGAITNAMRERYVLTRALYPVRRFLTAILYLVGMAFLAIPTGATFWNVSVTFYRNLSTHVF